jgi:hypothetical protein
MYLLPPAVVTGVVQSEQFSSTTLNVQYHGPQHLFSLENNDLLYNVLFQYVPV